MELNFSKEDLKRIFLVSYHYFYNPGNPSKYSTEFNVMSHNLRERIAQENPNSLIESGIITILSYFLDSEFIVQCDPFPANLPPFANPVHNNVNIVIPAMPMNWRNSITLHACGSFAHYFIRQQNQVFTVNVLYTSHDRKVEISVRHITVDHEPLLVRFREVDLLALSDPQHALPFAIHCLNDCYKKFTKMVKKAALDLAPTARTTPIG